MVNDRRLIELAFPLKQASLDSVHEKNVRHGHISTLHIWPARRPLAACRAALIATLLPDPGTPEERKRLIEKIGGTVVQKIERKVVAGKTIDVVRDETVGGILHWGRESNPDVDWFRQEIRKAYGGRAPKVLDPFAGGGAIPLEAMRLGCEVTAIDINPVAWFILKCTLEYPQKLAGQHRPLPQFALESPEFMESFFKSTGKLTKKQLERNLQAVQSRLFPAPDVDLSWHVRAWGWWVLQKARKELARFYPTYASFEALQDDAGYGKEKQLRLVSLTSDGQPDIQTLNAEFDEAYLRDPRNPRWIAKPTVAYLWARTVTCKNCRATIPLLKTRWLCKKEKKRVLLKMEPNAERTGVVFEVDAHVPQVGGNAAQRREHDKRIGGGTMSKSGAKCPCCQTIMTLEDIRLEGQAQKLGMTITTVVVEGSDGKEYRLPTTYERQTVQLAEQELPRELASDGRVTLKARFEPASTRSISIQLYGVKTYLDLFAPRQAYSLCNLAGCIRFVTDCLQEYGYSDEWREAIRAYLALSFDRLLSFTCVNVRWKVDAEAVVDAFSRFSISILWDFAESQPVGESAGSWQLCYERISTALDTYNGLLIPKERVNVLQGSAAEFASAEKYDVVMTDPPYYQAISYADLSDFFYVWLRGLQQTDLLEFLPVLTPKDREIVQHIREDKDRAHEKVKYEQGMSEAFSRAYQVLNQDGRFVCVFAHKDPEAWETLVSAMIRAGFVVTSSWPIQTEMASRQRATTTAALSSSVWLVCKKRVEMARPGWDNLVLEDMRANIQTRLREYWDAGIRGPDFIWAATGPGLEAYSKHPVVKKANDPGKLMEVDEFLRQVRRIVVDFVVGRVLSHNGGSDVAIGLDDITTYYLLHRHDFGLEDAPIGACILYAISCNLSDRELIDQCEILIRSGGRSEGTEDEGEGESEDKEAQSEEEGTGSQVKLKPWQQRKNRTLGYEGSRGRPAPLIDQVHRLMHIWRSGDQVKVDEYVDSKGLRNSALFSQLLQALIELAKEGSEERSLLESISNHIAARGAAPELVQRTLPGT